MPRRKQTDTDGPVVETDLDVATDDAPAGFYEP